MLRPGFLPHEQQVFWEFYLKWFYVLLVCFYPPFSPSPFWCRCGVGGSELNFESCSASTRIAYSHVLQRQTLG